MASAISMRAASNEGRVAGLGSSARTRSSPAAAASGWRWASRSRASPGCTSGPTAAARPGEPRLPLRAPGRRLLVGLLRLVVAAAQPGQLGQQVVGITERRLARRPQADTGVLGLPLRFRPAPADLEDLGAVHQARAAVG